MRRWILGSVTSLSCLGSFCADEALAQSSDILLNCTTCHSLDQTGNPQYPVLNGQPALYILQQLAAYRNGLRQHPQMQSTATALGAGGAPAMARMYADAPSPVLNAPADIAQHADARKLVTEGDWGRGLAPCVSCHTDPQSNPDDSKIRLSAHAAPRIHGQPEGYLSATLHAYSDGTRQTGGLKRMQAYAGLLTDAEIAALADYLAAFAEPGENQ